MKKCIYSAALVSALILGACGDTTEENIGGTVEENGTEENSAETSANTENESTDDAVNEINQVIVDNENVKATLLKITKVTDDIWGNSYEVIFDVENKRSDSIEVQARSVSADGRMVDDMLLSMSQEVAPGKSAYATLKISEFDGYEFPELKSDFEMTLHIFSWDNYDYTEDHPVKVTF